jgi:hypothetical protein
VLCHIIPEEREGIPSMAAPHFLRYRCPQVIYLERLRTIMPNGDICEFRDLDNSPPPPNSGRGAARRTAK